MCSYNDFRPDQAVAGILPNDVYRTGRVIRFASSLHGKFKSVPLGIGHMHFAELRATGWRLKPCA